MQGQPCIPDSHPHRITSTKCRKNTVISPDDGHIVARNTYRLININIVRINCALSWFYLEDYIEMHGQQNIEPYYDIYLESGVLRKVFGPERREVQEAVENCMVRSCIISFPRCIYYLSDEIKQYQLGGVCVRHVRGNVKCLVSFGGET